MAQGFFSVVEVLGFRVVPRLKNRLATQMILAILSTAGKPSFLTQSNHINARKILTIRITYLILLEDCLNHE